MKNSILGLKPAMFTALVVEKLKGFFLFSCLLAAAFANVAVAQNNGTWQGNTSVNWNTAANWNSGSGPVPTTGDNLFFGNAGTAGATLTNDIASGTSFNSITFNNGGSAFIFRGNSIGLTGGMTNISGSFQIISNAIVLGANATLNDGGGGMTLNGAISGSYSLTNAGSGTVILSSGNNSLTGGVTINNGTLQVSGSGGNSGLGAGDTIVNSSGILVGATADGFGYKTGHNAPSTIYINGGTVTDLGTANYQITLPNLTFTGGTLTSAVGNAGSSGSEYSFNGNNSTMTINTVASSATATISAGGIITQRQTTFNVASGTVTGGATPGVDMLVSSALLPTSGHHGITKTGAGVLELTGASTFIYGVGINGGVIIVGGTQTGSAGPLGGVGNGNDTISFGGGTLQYSSVNAYDYSPRFSTAANQAYSFNLAGQNVIFASALTSSGGSLALTNSGLTGGTLTLSAANTYSGNTAINGGTMLVGGSLVGAVSVGNGTLCGSGTINGAVTTMAASAQINEESNYLVTATVGTLALGSSLNMSSGGACYLDVSTSHSSGNDFITVGGTLTLNGNTFHINALGGSSALDAGGDYILIQGSSPVSGTVNATPTWDGTPPGNSADYIVEILGDNVVLHNTTYAGVSIISASATPSSVSRYQSALLSVAVTNGTPGYNVTVDASSIGAGTVTLYTNSSTGIYSFTNKVTPSADTTIGTYSLPVTVNDSASGTASGSISLTVVGASQVWSADMNGSWDTSTANWQASDIYQDGDFARFDDSATGVGATNVNFTTTLSPGGIIVSNTAGSPTADYTFGDNNTGSGAISGTGALIKQGSGTLTLTEFGGDSFSGGVIVGGGLFWCMNDFAGASGGLTVSNGTALLAGIGSISGNTIIGGNGTVQVGNNNTYGSLSTGPVTMDGTLIFNRTDAGNISVNNAIGGAVTGTLIVSNSAGTSLTLGGANTFSGNVTVDGGTLIDSQIGNGSSGGLGAAIAGKTITVNSGATLVVPQNAFGGNTVAGANMPSFIVNGGTVNDTTKYTAIGSVTLNNGAILTQSPSSVSGTYQGYQFRGAITVGGSSPSTISSGNGTDNHLDTNTVFNVADVTGDSGADLTVSTGLRNTSGDFGTVPASLVKTGTGTMLLAGTNTYTGNTTISAGTLALGVSDASVGSISNSLNIIVAGGATFDVSGLPSTFVLGSGQTLSNATSTAVLNGRADVSAGTVSLTYASGMPSLLSTNGTLTLASTTTFKIKNTGAALAAGTYTIITNAVSGNTGSVAVSVTLPSVTVAGGGLGAGTVASLQIGGGALNLVVTSATPPTPRITGISLSGTTLTITATNGADDGTYVLLESTNVALPLNQWTPVLTNTFGAGGSLNLSTNIINFNNPQEFYILLQ